MENYTQQALTHINYLSQAIGGRGSCTPKERLAGEYVSDQLRVLGVQDICEEPFRAIASTYRPFTLAFISALIGTLAVSLFESRWTMLLATALNILGAWAMLAQTDLASNWTRWLLPKGESQNITGVIQPANPARQRVVLCAHLDTHRTPIFYSSTAWHSAFSALVGLALISMLTGSIFFGLGAALDWGWVRGVSFIIIPVQVFALVMCLHADFTPYSPGANDNASGVGVVLSLASRLISEPLSHTEVHLAFTGCEEVGAYGIAAYLDAHASELGEETVYIILDEVGHGDIKFLSSDGLLLKRKTHPRALDLLRKASDELPDIKTVEMIGLAYTDALAATKRGLIALTICQTTEPDSGGVSHWHQMSDTMEHLDSRTLTNTHQFTWEILQEIDRSAPTASQPA